MKYENNKTMAWTVSKHFRKKRELKNENGIKELCVGKEKKKQRSALNRA